MPFSPAKDAGEKPACGGHAPSELGDVRCDTASERGKPVYGAFFSSCKALNLFSQLHMLFRYGD